MTEFDPINEKFNPEDHEAMFKYPDDSVPHNTVGQVLQTGYKLNSRVLRPAKVNIIYNNTLGWVNCETVIFYGMILFYLSLVIINKNKYIKIVYIK